MADAKIEIEISKLLAAMTSKRDRLAAEYKEAKKEYDIQIKAYEGILAKGIRDLISKPGFSRNISSGRLQLPDQLYGGRPSAPSAPNVERSDYYINQLKLTSQQVVFMAPDDIRLQFI